MNYKLVRLGAWPHRCAEEMNSETKKILLESDEKGHWEFPPQSALGVSWDDIDSLLPELEKIMGVKLDVDRNVQDASFLTDLGYLDDRYYDREKKCGALSYTFSFRFSNFGRLFTLFGSATEDKGDIYDCALRAKQFISTQGFTFIEEGDLHELYDGKNVPFDEKLSWWTRFFDYL